MFPNATSTPLSDYSTRKNRKRSSSLSPAVLRNVSTYSKQTNSIRGLSNNHYSTNFIESSKLNSVKYAPLVVMNSESEDSEYEFEICSLTSRRTKVKERIVKKVNLKEKKSILKKTDQEQFPQIDVNDFLNGSSKKFKPMGDKSLNAYIKQVEKNRDILVQPLSRIRKMKPSQSQINRVENKENIVRKINEVDIFVKKNIKSPESEDIYSLENFQWKDGKQEGISTLKLSSIVYVKIKPKCTLTRKINLDISISVKVFVIILGNALVTINSKKTKVGPGDVVMVSSDWSIMNTGVSKNLILHCIKE